MISFFLLMNFGFALATAQEKCYTEYAKRYNYNMMHRFLFIFFEGFIPFFFDP